jgi:hypothetical protein
LHAQTVIGQVIDSTSGTPVGTGFVVLVDQDQVDVARTLTNANGQFSLRAPQPGIFQLRSERIGYRAHVSHSFELTAGITLPYNMEVAAIPIVLSAVEVTAENRCQVSPDRASETGVLWEEVRKALEATAWDGTQELARYRTYSFERELSSNRRRIMRERGRTLEGVARQPYVSLPADYLAQFGYVIERPDETVYNLPDARVLTDDAFLSTHCFRVVRDQDSRPGQVGLAFDPVSHVGRPDVRGTLWLDEENSQLTTLDIRFARLPDRLQDRRVGGTVEFLMLPSGAWIIQYWEVRSPIMQVGRAVNPFDRDRRQTTVRGFRDVGREVLEITTGDGTKIYPAHLAHVTGTINDSTTDGPLAGVRVQIADTDFWAESDATGAFHVTAPVEGNYAIALTHPWLDSLAYVDQRPVALARGMTNSVSFQIPHARTMLRRLCPETTDPDSLGVLFGVVGREGSVDPVSDAQVTASWQIVETSDQRLRPRVVEVVVRTDDSGFYVLCRVPTGHPVTVSARHGESVSRTTSLVFPESEEGSLLQALNRGPGQPYADAHSVRRRLWKLDFRLSNRGTQRATGNQPRSLSGVITDRTSGRPLNAVTVTLNGRDTVATRVDGTFDIADARFLDGANVVTMRRLGYDPWVQEIWLDDTDERLELSVRLRPQAVALDPVDVTAAVAAERYLTEVGFLRRQRENAGGYFLDRQEVEQRAARARFVTELLTGVAGVVVLDSKVAGRTSTVQFRGMLSLEAAQQCATPRIYVDGFVVDTEDLAAIVTPQDVYAIEAYRTPSEVPIEYGGSQSGCGVLLIWTRRGG